MNQTADKKNTGSMDILIVEDDAVTAATMCKLLSRNGYQSEFALTLNDAMSIAKEHSPRLVLLDLSLPDGNGLDAMSRLKQCGVQEVIIVSGTHSPDDTRQCLRAGAFDFIVKPAAASELLAAVRRADADLKLENLAPGSYPSLLKPGFGSLEGGDSLASKLLMDQVKSAAAQLQIQACLITGPAGSLKNDIAASIHNYSASAGSAWLINCAGEKDDYAMQRFAGCVQGTDSTLRPAPGYLLEACEGTVVLDDLSALPMDIQRMLVDEYLQSGSLPNEGGRDLQSCKCALIAVLREDAESAIEGGRLLKKLYQWLAKNKVDVPRLQDRSEDIVYFVKKAVEQLNAVFDLEKGISESFLKELQAHDWTGDLVELRNLVLVAYRLTEPGEDICIDGVLPFKEETPISSDIGPFVGMTLHDAERQLVQATLEKYRDNKRKAAEILGISTKTLYNRLKTYEASSPA